MDYEDESDPVVSEVPVFLTKKISDKLHILQYPVRPQQLNYDKSEIIQARLRPKCFQLEMQVGIKTKSYHYDQEKGKQIALNVDGMNRDMKSSDDNFFKSEMMDKLVLTSTKNINDCKRYAVGVVTDEGVHISPVSSFITMKPKCTYLDMADSRKQNLEDFENDADTEELATDLRKVSVRFERHETEYRKNAREKSYEFLQRKIREEAWVDMNVHKFLSERSEYERRGLYCAYENEKVECFRLEDHEYLDQLAPKQIPLDICSDTNSKEKNHSSLRDMPLQQHLNNVMNKVNLATFDEIVKVLDRNDCDPSTIVKCLQKEAVLVQGCWVVKSDVLFNLLSDNLTGPAAVEQKAREKAAQKHNISGTTLEVLQKARDYALYLFTKKRLVKKLEIEEVINIGGFDLVSILQKIALPVTPRGTWEFLLPTDHHFISKNKEIVQRQQMIWQSKHEQLSNSLNS